MHANFHLNVISRSEGRSAVAASAYRSAVACAAYRSGDKIHDERYEKTHDYSKKENVLHSAIVTPDGAPEWMKDREKLWNAVEAGEKRKDARLAKEALLVLPRNLDADQQKEVVETFIRDNITKHGLVADYAIHSPDASDGGQNPHAHIMFTLRPVEGGGFGKKLTGFKNVLDSPDTIPQWRNSYETILNDVSSKTDEPVRFDLRSLKQKGIDREPQLKIGPKVNYLEKRGYETEWGKEVRLNKHQNNALTQNRQNGFYYQIGGSSYRPSQIMESIREDVARKYYEVMYGAEHARSEEELANQRGWDYER